MTETRTTQPLGVGEYDIIESSNFGFRMRHRITGVTYRCHIGWKNTTNWFLQTEDV